MTILVTIILMQVTVATTTILTAMITIKRPDNPTCLCFCSRARVIAHAILQVSVRMCVGWCVLVCVRSCVLVGMCRQRCALIVAHCARACMSARVNACSSTAGLDLTRSSGNHRARACANGRFHPALTCQSAVPGKPSPARQERRRPTSTARSCRWGRPAMITEAGAHFLAFPKVICEGRKCVYHHDHAVSIGSADRVRVPFPRTGCGKQKCFKTTGPYEACSLIASGRVPAPLRSGWTSGL